MWRRRDTRAVYHTANLEDISAMNVQEAMLRDADADQARDPIFVDRSSFPQRTAAVALAAAAEAEQVDRDARFPQTAIDTARQQRLLGIQIPLPFGGDGASIPEIAEMCYTLGRACASTAMIFAMHQTKVACLVRHGTGSELARGTDAPRGDRADAAGVIDHRRPERRQHPLLAPPPSSTTIPRFRWSAMPP